MAISFLSKSRHGSVFYFRRRVPDDLRRHIGKPYLVKSLHTYERRAAIILARSLAAHTDKIFIKLREMANRASGDELSVDFSLEIELNDLGRPAKITVQAEPHEQDAVNSALATAMSSIASATAAPPPTGISAPAGKPYVAAFAEYYEKSGLKPNSKATNRSKLNHAQAYFGESHDVLTIDQKQLVEYADHVRSTIKHETTQGLYIQTVSGFLNWHRIRAGLPELTTRTLIPKRKTPVTSDRDSFTLDQMKVLFENAAQYRDTEPHKYWVTVAVPFLGCRLEELAQVNLETDLVHDAASGIWYFRFDELPDDDGETKKSIKKPTSWRYAPIHSALVRHGFLSYLDAQRNGGATRPFEFAWKPRIVEEEGIHKWSHYISRWGGRELTSLDKAGLLSKGKLGYFHSMRHTFAGLLGDAGVPSELIEALSGRRYGGTDQERYEKLKKNHVRLSQQGVEAGLGKLTALLDAVHSGDCKQPTS